MRVVNRIGDAVKSGLLSMTADNKGMSGLD